MQNAVICKVLGLGIRGDGFVIAVLRGKKSMKKLILKVKDDLTQDDLGKIARKMRKQWSEGLIVIPENYNYELVSEEWVDVEKLNPPKNQTLLVWIEYEQNDTLCQSYGFGSWNGDGWTVYLQEAKRVLAWMTLPEPYLVGDV